ncbi:MAG: aminotransferase class III-fold pyridoxal phosphate-dependent enzyme [Deltaproteobacteria bacterium]|nr:aminotransferase class III-fold pyridoxal phosphate-dependent enzyme [Deltaproteobacteria bacterium]MBT4087266.1 aminotransferase class III-fold pyridoxal phosphate-dependent enzyme [Deltaproteobacteria bacterium]MBT4269520.1 aminotransferase class III-fold pyridoxal phosphate-dependent enzyme [Deltaproteobacteria bacterium]MBT4642637.1 aminotransferase class III-fold pyridoxal phosphate-dependent enzyme [Deltaproteobacteria bacterium]MBT6501300.1 aminotransferase class III-fold pyridoxal ph
MDAVFTDVSQYGDVRNLEMIKRRQDHLGGSILFYHDPINIVRGEGVWLYDDLGNKYLDCYNNVASVGHCNPNVVEALIAQARQLNTHTRYLHKNVIDYAEKLSGLMPAPLEVCLFTCTGTEANELAMRIARSVSGKHGAIVMESSYHGNSTLITQMSTALYPANLRPDFIKTVEPPNTYRGPFREGEHNDLGRRYADLVDEAIDDLEKNGHGTAAFMCDMIFDSQGSLCAPEEYFRRVYDKIHSAGGLCIADEVQPGLCRTGTWWGFENYGVVPDIVVLGKPMGDGHPVAAVVTSKEIIEKFTESQVYFNTFAGNPVSAAVGMAVLDECLDQKLVQNCAEVGAYFRKRLEVLAEKYPIIGHIHGMGLFLGIELVHDRKSKEPANDITRLVPDAMKNAGVLMGATGRFGNVLKIRPPLIFSKENVDQTIEALDKVLPEAVKTAGKEAPVDIQSGTATMQIDQGIVTEQLLLKALEKGCRCIQAAGNIVITPLARDIAREHKIKIERM